MTSGELRVEIVKLREERDRLRADARSLEALLKGSEQRAQVLFEAKNYWAEKARELEVETLITQAERIKALEEELGLR